jgi:hypothetical protein
MLNYTATLSLTAIGLAALGVLGYLAGVISGHAALGLFLIGCLLNVVWFFGVLIEGARSEHRHRRRRGS